VEVNTPEIMDRELWVAVRPHRDVRREHVHDHAPDERTFAIKPMNCPGHIQVFKQGLRSYRELPLRDRRVRQGAPLRALRRAARADAGARLHAGRCAYFLHRGADHRRVGRGHRADPEHLRDFGFDDVRIKFSDRPAKRVGSDEIWDKAEAALKAGGRGRRHRNHLNPGEGAFYGPKLEFVLRDAIGRDWQCGTLQVDLSTCRAPRGELYRRGQPAHTPVMLHRAMFGSLERFIGILLEHHAGKLPTWLSPVQAWSWELPTGRTNTANKLRKT
jgi:threonyl-tRNA synthetase